MLTHSRSVVFALTLLVLGLTTVLAAAVPPLHARVSHVDESALVRGPEDEDWAFVTVNALILPGDTLWADKEGTLEVEFTGGTFLRMVDGSRVDIESLPPDGTFQASVGSFYVQRVSRSTGAIFFETPVSRVEVERDSQVRFDVLSDGATTVSVRWGRATIRGGFSNPMVVEQGRRSYIDPGYAPSIPVPFDLAAEDAFDTWNRDRARLLALGTEHVRFIETSAPYEPLGVADLNTYGEWISVDYDYYWRPTFVDGFVPYRSGYWSYAAASGYAWVGYHPFSYITSHYGYWSHHDRYGWLWEYHDAYAPAYVTAMRYGDYFLWAPISRYGYPVHHGGFRFTAGDFRFSLGACSYVRARDLFRGPATVNAFGRQQLGQVDNSDIFIWNININNADSSGARRTYTTPLRSFTPERSIRGFSTARTVRGNARERAAQLESTVTRARPELSSSRTVRSSPTPSRAENRRASVRTIRISRAASTESQSTVSRATRAAANTRTLTSATRRARFTNDDVGDARPLQQYHPSTWTGRTESAARTNTPSSVRGTRRTNAPTQSSRAASTWATRESTATTRSIRTGSSASAPSARATTPGPPRQSRGGASNVTRTNHRPSTRTTGTSRVRESAPSPAPRASSSSRIGPSTVSRSEPSPLIRSARSTARGSRSSSASGGSTRESRVAAPPARTSRSTGPSISRATRRPSRQPSARASSSPSPSRSRSSSASTQRPRGSQPQVSQSSPRRSSARVSSPSTGRSQAGRSPSSGSTGRSRTRTRR